MVFIELKKFDKKLETCVTDLEDWLFFLQNAEDLTFIPKNISATIETAYEVSNRASLTQKEMDVQYAQEQFIAVQLGSVVLAKEKGIEEGIEKRT